MKKKIVANSNTLFDKRVKKMKDKPKSGMSKKPAKALKNMDATSDKKMIKKMVKKDCRK